MAPTASSPAARPARASSSRSTSGAALPRRFELACTGTLVVHAGAQTTADTSALAGHAAEIGADAVAVIPPPYFELDADELTAHFVSAARACAPLPFYCYAFTARSGYPLPVEVIRRIGESVDNLAGLKVSEAPFERVEPYLELGLPVLIGNEPLIADGIARGAIGTVSGMSAAFPDVVRTALDAADAPAMERLRSLRIAMEESSQFIAAAKHVLGLRGVPVRAGHAGAAARPGRPRGGERSKWRLRRSWLRRRPDRGPASLNRCRASGGGDVRRGLCGTQRRVARLDLLVDDPQPAVERPERRLHRVQRQPFHVVEPDPERPMERRELAAERDPAHQPVVGVDGDPEAEPAQQIDRVLLDGGGGAGVHVGRRAHLERHAPIAHVGSEPAERHPAVAAAP